MPVVNTPPGGRKGGRRNDSIPVAIPVNPKSGKQGKNGDDSIPILLPNTVIEINLAATGTVTTLATVPGNAYAWAPGYFRNEGTAGNWIIAFGGLTPSSSSYSVKLGPGDSSLGTMGEAFKEANLPIGTVKAYNDNPGSGGTLSGFVAYNDGTSILAGPTGPQGLVGLPGRPGEDGEEGPMGLQGVPGPQGLMGPQGPPGIDGIDGEDGAQGPQGLKGDTGAQGATGATGATGAAGTNGTNGTGADTYTNKFRLTLASGYPVYNPQNATPNSRSSNTASFAAAHNWVNGTICTPNTTGGGLTAGTRYYIHVVSSTSVSFHTSVTGANDGSTNIVTLSGTPNQINVSGVENTTLYCSPYNGDQIGLFDGSSTWNVRSSAEFSIALGTLTSGLPYDVFCYDNSTVPTLELLAWTNGTTRATALVQQNGVWVKSGATTRRYIGTIYTRTTTTTADDVGGIITQVGGQRYVWNFYNRVTVAMEVVDNSASFSYTTATWQQFNGASGNKVEFIVGFSEDCIFAESVSTVDIHGNSARRAYSGIGLDTTTGPTGIVGSAFESVSNDTVVPMVGIISGVSPVVGYHYVAWVQRGADGTCTWDTTDTIGLRTGVFANIRA
jgi:hypothetical protein